MNRVSSNLVMKPVSRPKNQHKGFVYDEMPFFRHKLFCVRRGIHKSTSLAGNSNFRSRTE